MDNPERVETEGGKGGKERNFSWSDSLMDRESGLTDLFRGGRRAVEEMESPDCTYKCLSRAASKIYL